MNDNSSRIMDVDINEILPNRFQPRIQFDEEEILELSDSIKEHGVIQPIVVRTIGDKYEIIAGERRYKASVLAGKETVPVIVKNLNDRDSAEIALIENVQRKNLTPIEEALSYKKILDMGYMTQETLASKLGRSQSSVANKIRLLNLSDDVQEALLENKISERHARSLLRLTTSDLQNKMLKRIINERLTVRRTDEEIDKMKNEPSDDDNDSSQKIIEKGEINMNNNINMMPNTTSNPTGSFDIFGTSEQPQQPVNPFMSVPAQPSYDMGNNAMNINPATQSFGMFQTPVATPEQPQSTSFATNTFDLNTPVAPVTQAPTAPVEPSIPEMPAMGGIQFDANGTVVDAPVSNSTPVEMPQFDLTSPFPSVQNNTEESNAGSQFNLNTPVAPIPTMEQPVPAPQSATPTGIQFDANGMVVSAPTSAPGQTAGVPETAPIIENPVPVQPVNVEPTPVVPDLNTTFSFGNTSEVNPNSVQMDNTNYNQPEEIKLPEPIIITDYNKQYDPVMPASQEPVKPVVDFKEVINAIRECSSKIEQYGFKIDVEEYDLANLYQVVFKIEK